MVLQGEMHQSVCVCVCVCVCVLSHSGHVQLFATPRTTARKAPLSMGLSRQEYWSGLPFASEQTGKIAHESSDFQRMERISRWRQNN